MEEFLKSNRPLLVSTLFLFAAFNLFSHFVLGGYQRLSLRNAEVIRTAAATRNGELTQAIKSLVVQNKPSVGSTTSTPAFLAEINALARANGIGIDQISGDRESNSSFQIDTRADFPAFLRFLAAVEGLDVEILKLQVTPTDLQDKSANRQVVLSIAPRDSGAVPSPDRVATVRQSVDTLSTAAFSPAVAAPSSLPDSGTQRITGITEINGTLIATIDNIDYAVGDKIGTWVVSDISRQSVVLTDPAKGKRAKRVLSLR